MAVAPFNIVMQGDKQLLRALNTLGAKAEQKVVSGAVRFSMTPMRKSAKRNAPRRHGGLRDSIGIKMKRYRSSGWMVGILGPVKNKGRHKARGREEIPAFYAHIVEGGSKRHFIRAKSSINKLRFGFGLFVNVLDHPGTKPTHFLRNAFRTNVRGAKKRFQVKMWRGIVKQTKLLQAGGVR